MTGNEEFLNAKERLARFVDATERYINTQHVGLTRVNPEVVNILNYDSSVLHSLTSEQCLAAAYVLFSYADHLQTVYNSNLVKLHWASDAINKVVAPALKQYGDKYTKHEQKYYEAVQDNEFARSLNNIKIHATARVDMLTEKMRDVRRMGDVLIELSKRKQYS
jgi:hypothetical protein|tara:strand:- start:70407 stop:70898 length:492 start_codon:yes stop_codon:yes gene_type:complete